MTNPHAMHDRWLARHEREEAEYEAALDAWCELNGIDPSELDEPGGPDLMRQFKAWRDEQDYRP